LHPFSRLPRIFFLFFFTLSFFVFLSFFAFSPFFTFSSFFTFLFFFPLFFLMSSARLFPLFLCLHRRQNKNAARISRVSKQINPQEKMSSWSPASFAGRRI